MRREEDTPRAISIKLPSAANVIGVTCLCFAVFLLASPAGIGTHAARLSAAFGTGVRVVDPSATHTRETRWVFTKEANDFAGRFFAGACFLRLHFLSSPHAANI